VGSQTPCAFQVMATGALCSDLSDVVLHVSMCSYLPFFYSCLSIEIQLTLHTYSVYCLEFDSTRIISGSRDKTIKVWSLRTGGLLGTFRGHVGSVLCLKFDQDWDEVADWVDDESEGNVVSGRMRTRPGFMVSGSSDCSICVWDMHACRGGEGEVKAEVRTVLRGHSGGVLDLRIDRRWIVSW
jgi:F-box and WD-40 domain protein 1/11